jgi:hypothetical protein
MTPRLDPYVMTLMTKEIMMFRQTVASGDSQGHGIYGMTKGTEITKME